MAKAFSGAFKYYNVGRFILTKREKDNHIDTQERTPDRILA